MADRSPSDDKDFVKDGKSFFKAKSDKVIRKKIEAARKKALENQDALLKAFIRTNPIGAIGTGIIKSLRRSKRTMLAHHTAKIKKPSTRARLDQTGKPFHFAHSYVSADGSIGGTGKKATKAQEPGNAKKERHGSQGAAHMAYLERDGAIEKLAKFAEHDGHGLQFDEDRNMRIDAEIGIGLDPADRARRMQEYVENDAKVETVKAASPKTQDFAFSFGTIGETPKERQDFWTLVEKHKERGKSRLQYRLILELPHQASPEARHEAVRRFCEETFGKNDLPYWAVLHAPTAKNDPRNFHAHVVYLARPAKQIEWPEGGMDGKPNPDGSDKKLVPTWDFAAFTHLPDENKHRRIQYPNRQNILDVTRQQKFIKGMRKAYADIVNETMTKHRIDVRYDHRSYKDMGLKTEAMQSSTRGVHAATKGNKMLAMDVVNQDRNIKAVQNLFADVAFLEHRKAVGKLLALDDRIKEDIDRARQYKRLQRALPPDLKDSRLLSKLTKTGLHNIRKLVLERKLALASKRHELAVTRSTLQFIVDATDPAAMKKTRSSMARSILNLEKKKRTMKAGPEDEYALDQLKAQVATIPTDDFLLAIHQQAIQRREAFEKDNAREIARLRPMATRILNALRKSGAEPRDPLQEQSSNQAAVAVAEQARQAALKATAKAKAAEEERREKIRSAAEEYRQQAMEFGRKLLDQAVRDLPLGANPGVAIHLGMEEAKKAMMGDAYKPPSDERKANMFTRDPKPGEDPNGRYVMGYDEALAQHALALERARKLKEERLAREEAAKQQKIEPAQEPKTVETVDDKVANKKKKRRKAVLSQAKQDRSRGFER